MNTFTFRVATVSVGGGGVGGGGLYASCVKSLPLMQRLFEEQATLFHLAEHLFLLSLTVNVRNVGKKKPSGGARRILTQPHLNPCSQQEGTLPSASLQQLYSGSLYSEKACSNTYNNKLRIRENIPQFCIWVKFFPTWGFGQSMLRWLLLQLIIRIYKKTHTVFRDPAGTTPPPSSQRLHLLSQKSTPVSQGTGPEQTAAGE